MDMKDAKELELNDLELEVINLEADITEKQDRLNDLQEEINGADSTEKDFIDQRKEESRGLKKEVRELQAELKRVHHGIKKVSKELQALPAKQKLAEAIIKDQENDHHISDEDVSFATPKGSKQATKEWLEKMGSPLENQDKNSILDIKSDDGGLPSHEELVERLRKLKEVKSNEPKKEEIQKNDSDGKVEDSTENFVEKDSTEKPYPTSSMMEAMTQALSTMTQFVQSQQSKQDNATGFNEKYIARQSHSKDLPLFNGKPEEWPAFISDFKRTTELCKFTDAENLSRLRKCLKGEALKSVQCLMVSPESLPKVMEALERRFGQVNHIIAALVQKVRKVNGVREDRPETWMEFGTAVTNLTSTIEALGRTDQLQNPTLLLELEGKLPYPVRMQWTEWLFGDKQRKNDLLHFSMWVDMKTQVVYHISPADFKEEKGQRAKDDPHGYPWKYSKNKERVHAADVKTTEKVSTEKKCFYCEKSGHMAGDCNTLKKMSVEQRRMDVGKKRLCFNCFVPGHVAKDCRGKNVCGKNGCQHKHHNLLHIETEVEAPPVVVRTAHSTDKVDGYNEQTGILGILKVKLSGPNGDEEVFALVDQGSTTCLIEEETATSLGLNGKELSICIKGVESTGERQRSKLVNVGVSGCYAGAKQFHMNFVKTLKGLNLGPLTLDIDQLTKKNPLLHGLPLESFHNVRPKILIGADYCYLTEPLKIVARRANEPRGYKSRLGWYVSGALQQKRDDRCMTYHVCNVMDFPLNSTENDAALSDLVKKSFSTEDFGVKVTHEKPRSREDERAMQLMISTTRKIESENRYETGLLWKSDNIDLPESYSNAFIRLKCQERKMDKDTEFADLYCKKMAEYEEKGFIRKISPMEDVSTENSSTDKSKRLWYLPHFGVKNPNKPGKIRLVFDAAAESHGMSLNKALVQGPDLNNSIVSVLLKFRQYEYAFAGDIKDMFHRVLIRSEDRHSQRFLWRGTDRSRHPDEYEMLVMIFGSACSPSGAQYVKNENANQYSAVKPVAVKAIKTKFYVDDYLDSRPTKEEACAIIQDVIEIQRKASFEVCNWVSNSVEVIDSVPVDLRATDYRSLDFENPEMPTGRILGLWWDTSSDVLTFRLNSNGKISTEILNGKRPTKRQVLSLVMSVYDPLGFVGHFVIQGKILLQDIWRTGIGFDDTLPDSVYVKWMSFIAQLKNLTQVQIPRCYSKLIPYADQIQLHVFCDASEKAFAAVAYLRVSFNGKPSAENATKNIDVNIVLGRTRVAPMKTLSIPRLELQAAVMAARMAETLRKELEIEIQETVYWSDSTVVLCQIRNNEKRFKTFVSHRIGEIMESSDAAEWRWVPTEENPADDATRDLVNADLTPEGRWFNGPQFLTLPPEEWPVERTKISVETMPIEDLELKIGVHYNQEVSTDIGVYLKDYEELDELLVATAERFNEINGKTDLSVETMDEALLYWTKRSQLECFPEELQLLNGGSPLKNKSRLLQLSPIMKDGLLRMQSRLKKAKNMPENTKFPIILDPKHEFTDLLIDDCHRKCGHQGRETIASELRQRYWIINMGSAIRKVAWNCWHCKKARAKPCPPEMGDLPAARLEDHVQPFKNTGLDYFGPFKVTIGRRSEKRWGAIFTCMSTRAIHLELAGDLSTDSAIMAITRFARRRGAPENVYSDNGTNFRGADNELRECLAKLDVPAIQRKMLRQRISFHFNPPAAPHMGGAWERLVGSVKKVLKGLFWETSTKEEVIHTLFTEAEWIVNCRPLTHVSIDPDDPQPLTPNHFLIGWRNGNSVEGFNGKSPVNHLAYGEFNDDDAIGRSKWKKAQRLADYFWTRWVKEYLPTLARRTKWNKPSKPISVGDLVIIVDDQAPRNTWMQGRVVKVYPGKDGIVRVADVKTDERPTPYRRSVTKLCILEFSTDKNSTEQESTNN